MWEPPRISNPKCKDAPGCGEWKRPTTPNPDYKGKWAAPLIDNPAYKVSEDPGPLTVAFESAFSLPVNSIVRGLWRLRGFSKDIACATNPDCFPSVCCETVGSDFTDRCHRASGSRKRSPTRSTTRMTSRSPTLARSTLRPSRSGALLCWPLSASWHHSWPDAAALLTQILEQHLKHAATPISCIA